MSDFIILNGFDRSGSSAISRTLAGHPDIELIMQPFNSGFLRKQMYEILDKSSNQEEAHKFFSLLKNNKLNESLISSQWHYKYSSTREFVPGKKHLIKTTLNHFAQRWMNDHYPEIDVWGIWRDPYDIVSSIIRNGFYDRWYAEGLKEILPAVKQEESLKQNFLNFFDKIEGQVQEVGLLVAVRSYFFFRHLDKDKIINFEIFKERPNAALGGFLKYYQLGDFDFNSFTKEDLNIIGKEMKSKDKNNFWIGEKDKKMLDEIFQSLLNIYCDKK